MKQVTTARTRRVTYRRRSLRSSVREPTRRGAASVLYVSGARALIPSGRPSYVPAYSSAVSNLVTHNS
jgi:hypothetical protein